MKKITLNMQNITSSTSFDLITSATSSYNSFRCYGYNSNVIFSDIRYYNKVRSR